MDICSYIAGSVPLEKPEDLEVLLEIADAVRSFSDQGRREDIAGLIRYTIRFGYHEALYWILGILEEGALGGFECPIGRTIPDYEDFIRRLGVDLRAFQNDVVQVRDENGEVQSFFNIIRYQTAFDHIDLVTRENFDARDNDYIEYWLVCHF